LFTLLDPARTHLNFTNSLVSENDFNIIDYLYFYDGGGVALGDVNQDDLPDVFLTGNQVSDRLFLNQGGFQFKDITQSAGISSDESSWSTGVSMADINGDGWLDIYVCRVNYLTKTGHNLLYINQQDGTFLEESQRYGLDFEGLSTHSAWLDYDLDGDLDLYLLNHSTHSRESYVASWRRMIDAPRVGDKLYRQDDGVFVSVTAEAGIYSSALGYGLGIAVSDLNMDGWPDLYVGNDFHEDDYLYLNNGLGTFTESLWRTTGRTSRSTMGVDIADLNNDGFPDIVALDMYPPDLLIQRTAGNSNAEARMRVLYDFGYGLQVSRNTLQLHQGITDEGIPYYSDIAPFSGVDATDWSWAPLLGDFDGDGWKDLYVTNGIPGRPNDLDYIEYVANPDIQRRLQNPSLGYELQVAKQMPSAIVENFAFKGGSSLLFEDVGMRWGLADAVISNGAAYGDLDLDGDLDIIVNAINHPALVYRNESNSNYITIQLVGDQRNTSALGAKVTVWTYGVQQLQEQFPSRGFQSSVDHVLSFGLGTASYADSVVVIWPMGSRTLIHDVEAGNRLTLHEKDGVEFSSQPVPHMHARVRPLDNHGIAFTHVQDKAWDSEMLPLLPYWRSTRSPALAIADLNADGLDDLYMGGARDQPSALFIQLESGQFQRRPFLDLHQAYEDVDALFFDADQDGDQDLFVVSGGWIGPAELHQDRLYLNSGQGDFDYDPDRIPVIHSNGTVVTSVDFDLDGDIDLFVGSDTLPERYGEAGTSYLLENDGTGHFVDITQRISSTLEGIGHVTDAQWVDLVGDTLPDLALVGEWMPITIFENLGTSLINRTDSLGLSNSTGLWQSLIAEDLNHDGIIDLVAGNLGLNTIFQIPLALFAYDFNQDGLIDPIIAQWHEDQWFAWASRDALIHQLPHLSSKIPSYHEYQNKSIDDLFGEHIVPTHTIETLQSMVFWNDSHAGFTSQPMPKQVQWAPVIAMESAKTIHGSDIFISGNLSETSDAFGAANAGWGQVVHFTSNGEMQLIQNSGFIVSGDAREIEVIQGNPNQMIVARSNAQPLLFEFSDGNYIRQ